MNISCFTVIPPGMRREIFQLKISREELSMARCLDDGSNSVIRIFLLFWYFLITCCEFFHNILIHNDSEIFYIFIHFSIKILLETHSFHCGSFMLRCFNQMLVV